MHPGVKIEIFTTSNGWIAPSAVDFIELADTCDVTVEKGIKTWADRFTPDAGTYVAKFDSNGCPWEYIFTVEHELNTICHITVSP